MGISKSIKNILRRNNLKQLKDRINCDDCLVSVICLTFNHEQYIRKCLDGFLSQKTDFNVQIIIHDDASTDNTVKILEEYKNKYPNLITLILEKENQYSIDPSNIQKKFCDYIKGKYVAICEGDDYWNDENKLLLQCYLMEENADCNFCVHRVRGENIKTGELYSYPKFNLKSQKLLPKKYMRLVNNSYCFQTSSYFRRTSDFIKYTFSKPFFAHLIPNGDECYLLYYGSLGNTIFIDKQMSVYSKYSESSWTLSNKDISKEKKIQHLERMCHGLLEFDKFSNYKFHRFVARRYYGLQYSIARMKNEVKQIFKQKEFRHYILLHRFWLYCYCVYKYFLRK